MDSLSQLLSRAVQSHLAGLHTAFPAEITSYDHTQQRASVRPTLDKKLKDGRTEQAPVIANVPVWFPRAGGASMTFPVKPGDTALVVCSERSIDEWIASAKRGAPEDRRKHSEFDGIAFVGLVPFSTGSKAENNDDVLLTYQGSNVRLKPSGNIDVDATTLVEVTAPDVIVNAETENNGNVTINGNVFINGSITWTQTAQGQSGPAQFSGGLLNTGGDIVSDGVSLENHTHPGDSGGTTGPPN